MNDQEKITNDLDQAESLNNILNQETVAADSDCMLTVLEEESKPARKPRKKPAPKTDDAKSLEDSESIQQSNETPDTTPISHLESSDTENNENCDTVVSEQPSEDEDIEEFLIIGADGTELDLMTEETEISVDEDAEEKADEDIILPPDEIFAVPMKKEEDPESVPDAEECIDEDGQYRFSEIAAEPEPEDEEHVLLDYSEPIQEKYNEKKPRRIDGKFDFLELFVFTFLAVIIITSFFFKHSVVDGTSMEQTLYSGEHLIISDFFYSPKRGDVIVCEDYTTEIRKPIVKRVIAVEGDKVKITRGGLVYINGNELPLDESEYVYIDDPTYLYSEVNITVGKNQLFVMGDHRNMSTDSRVFGTVSEDSVLGKVILRFYPFDKFGTVN